MAANEARAAEPRDDDSLDGALVAFLLDVVDEEDTGQIEALSATDAGRVLEGRAAR